MLQFLTVPSLPDLDFHESNRFRLTWNIHVSLMFLFVPIITVSLFTQYFYAFYYGISLLLISTSLFFIRYTGNYRVFSIYVACALYFMIIYSMFSVDEYVHVIEPFWLLLIVLYVYFIHGKVWGGFAMFGTIVSTVLFFIINLNNTVENISEMGFNEGLSLGLELSVSLSLIGYILHEFIFLKNHAELELRLMNKALLKEKEIVESRDREKTILLQEIHHRVKNNLQIVMSLLRMQSTKIASLETKEHFNDAINRVLTMSLIHQKLYESENLSAVDFAEYIESLASDVLRSSNIPRDIDKTFSIEVPEVGMKTIVPIALIITELISNSVKHAFEETEHPEINLKANVTANSESLEMIYSDNGIWKDSDEDSFGVQLIEALTEQLEGSFELNIDETGSTYTFQFKQVD